MPLYTGVSGAKREIKKMFAGVSGAKREIKKLYAGVAGVSREIFSGETPLSDIPVGTAVKLRESGSWVDYLIVHQGKPSSIYDDSCNGSWLLREDLLPKRVYDSNNVPNFAESDIYIILNEEILGQYDSNIQQNIRNVKIPYHTGKEGSAPNAGANGLICKVFLLGGYEVGFTTDITASLPIDGAKLSYFETGTGDSVNSRRIALLNGSGDSWWLRSPDIGGGSNVWNVLGDGDWSRSLARLSRGIRPALVFPSDYPIQDDMTII